MKKLDQNIQLKKKNKKKLIELDLHGVLHEDVSRCCHRFINDNWASEKEGHIITGNSVNMKSIVFDVLKEYNIDFEESKMNNSGYVRIWFN